MRQEYACHRWWQPARPSSQPPNFRRWTLRIEAHVGVVAHRAGRAPGVGHGGATAEKRAHAGDGNRKALRAAQAVGAAAGHLRASLYEWALPPRALANCTSLPTVTSATCGGLVKRSYLYQAQTITGPQLSCLQKSGEFRPGHFPKSSTGILMKRLNESGLISIILA